MHEDTSRCHPAGAVPVGVARIKMMAVGCRGVWHQGSTRSVAGREMMRSLRFFDDLAKSLANRLLLYWAWSIRVACPRCMRWPRLCAGGWPYLS